MKEEIIIPLKVESYLIKKFNDFQSGFRVKWITVDERLNYEDFSDEQIFSDTEELEGLKKEFPIGDIDDGFYMLADILLDAIELDYSLQEKYYEMIDENYSDDDIVDHFRELNLQEYQLEYIRKLKD